jgi:MFS family permease
MTSSPERDDPTSARPYGSPAYSWYVVLLLAAVYAVHGMDRGLPNILLEPMREEFHLKDAQLGLFGMAFAVAFSAAVLPMGYISDRMNRRNMLAVILVIWSAMTSLGGFARSFGQMLLIRLGVGASEAGAAPLALPMITDIFPAHRRAFALGVFYMSAPVGGLLASIGGAYVAAEYGWRAAFFLAGIPGLILAVLLVLTVREPRRGASDSSGAAEKPPGMTEAFRFVVRSPALMALIAACVLMGLVNITLAFWMGSFFIRIHDVGLKETGLILGLGGSLIGMAAPPITGWLADRLGQRDSRWTLRIVWLSMVLSFVFNMAMLFSGHVVLAIAFFVISDFFRLGYSPPSYAVLMTHTPAHLRGGVMSIVQLATNLMGFGVGPALTGVLSDVYGGGDAIRLAMATLSVVFLFVVAVVLLANRLIHSDAHVRQAQRA